MAEREKRPLQEVYEDYFSYIYNMMYMHVLNRETAEDLTSEVFMKAFSTYAQYDPKRAGEKTWLSTIANHLLIDHYRSRSANKSDLVEDEVLTAIPCEDADMERICDTANDAVRVLMSELDPQERHLLEMRYYMDMKNPEIGEVLGINAKAVSERIRRLTEKCRKIAEARHIQEWL